jgi:hypothetical protein
MRRSNSVERWGSIERYDRKVLSDGSVGGGI